MEAYRRHVVIDNINKKIFIEVQRDLKGDIKQKEYWDLKNGLWYKYVPPMDIQQYQKAINGGFQVVPALNQGAMNEGFYIIQLIEITGKIPAIV